MARENRDWAIARGKVHWPTWGMSALGRTISAMLRRYGIEPAPERDRKTSWKEFLKRHWDLIVAVDFFTVEVWTRR
jgi:putative transposase